MSELNSAQITVDEKMIIAVLQCDELDEEHIQDLQSRVTAAAGQAPNLPVILDMSKVKFVPSLSLGGLLTLLQTCKQSNHRFILTGLQSSVRQVMATCRLDRLFEIYDSLDDVKVRLSS